MNSDMEVIVAGEDQWNSFFSQAVNPVPFSSSWWRNAICSLFDYNADYLILKNGQNSACGAIIYYSKGKNKFACHPALTPYNTLLFSPALGDRDSSKAVSLLLDFIRQNYAYPYLVLDTGAPECPRGTGWSSSQGNTYIVDPPSTILDSDIVRRSRRCEEEGFYVDFGFHPKAFSNLYMQTVNRQKITVTPDANRFIKFTEALFSSGAAWMASCYDREGRIHASWVQVGYNNMLYNWNAASDTTLMNRGGTSFLVTQMLTEIKKKYRKWDLCGADIPSVAKFKRGLGGTLVTYQKIYFNNYSIVEKVGLKLKKYFHI